MPPIVEVAAAVILRPDGSFLLGRRPPGKVYAGWWEFPGGKQEPGEPIGDALVRELREELGLTVHRWHPWITRVFTYPHATVRLHFLRVVEWEGDLADHEHDAIAWQHADRVEVAPMLPANAPVLKALALPPVYGITQAGSAGAETFLPRLERALAAGLRLVQVREKAMPEDALMAFTREVVARCREHGARVLVNGPEPVARGAGADGLHFAAARLMALRERPAELLCAASCHDAREIARAAELDLDFMVVGPVRPTPSHPGAPTLGWEGLAPLIADLPIPAFALGGLGRGDLERAWSCGAHGVAMVRGAWGL